MNNQQSQKDQDRPTPGQVENVWNRKPNIWMVSTIILTISLLSCLTFRSQQSSKEDTSYQGTAASQQLTPTNSPFPTNTSVVETTKRQTQTPEIVRPISPPSLPTTTQPPSSGSLTSITLVLSARAELLVTDPQGRRTGVDPRTGTTYNEIPDASYVVEKYADHNGQGVFDMSAPPNGSYIIQVIGTGSGAYTLDILNYDELGDPAEATVSGQIEKDNIDTYRLDYSSAPGSEVVVVNIDT